MQKIEPQQPFSSQRKRSRQTTVRMAKPSTTRKLSIQQSLITDNLITSEEEQKLGMCYYVAKLCLCTLAEQVSLFDFLNYIQMFSN